MVGADEFWAVGAAFIAEGRKALENTVEAAAFAVKEFLRGLEVSITKKSAHTRVLEVVFEERASDGEKEAEPRVGSV